MPLVAWSNKPFQLCRSAVLEGRRAGSRFRQLITVRRSMRNSGTDFLRKSCVSQGRFVRPAIAARTSSAFMLREKARDAVSNSKEITPKAHMSVAGSVTVVLCPASRACSDSGAAYSSDSDRGHVWPATTSGSYGTFLAILHVANNKTCVLYMNVYM